MKISIWDILTGLTLFGIVCLVGIFVVVAVNPTMGINPLKPLVTIEPLVLPSATPTSLGLPPTWTPTPRATQGNQDQPGSMPTLRPSRTPEPSATPVFLPTFTPSRTTRVGGTGGGLSGGECEVVYQNPVDDTVMDPGTSFDMRWTIKNTSSSTWASDSIDLRFVSGTRMHTGSDVRDVPYSVGPGGSVDIIVDMTAPGADDTYVSNWSLLSGNTSVCRFFVIIEVD